MDTILLIMFGGILIIGVSLMIIIAVTRKAPKGIDQEEFRSRWLRIESGFNVDENARHLSVMNADKLLDGALKARGFKGETMAERMKSAKNSFRDRNAIWTAHKLRNQIAHEDISVSTQAAKQALAAFKAALKDLGAI